MSVGQIHKISDPTIAAEVRAIWEAMEARTTARPLHGRDSSSVVGFQALLEIVQKLEARVTALENAP
jgi:hypothetical protein